MKYMSGDEIRRTFLEFFQSKDHLILPSSSLIPHGDPTLLLTNAGMVQFKPYFMGEAVPPRRRLTTSQKSFRTVDIDIVGDERHLTLFEMLGNFSIGDYFKREAITFAWELLTSPRHFSMPAERLWPTIHPKDDEAFTLWREITGVPVERIVRLEDNWWGPAGETGPNGPDSEIHFDRGEEYGCGEPDCKPGCECPRFLEIWNLVFMQFNRAADGTDTPLPRPSIDTGMGFERMALLLQGKKTCYETDLFFPIIQEAERLSGKTYGDSEQTDYAMRVIADHSRSVTFLIADGVLPSNEGRGYVLRRILRRAVRYGRELGLDEPFLTKTAGVVIAAMQSQYVELAEKRDFLLRVIDREEQRFGETLDGALGRLSVLFGELGEQKIAVIPGDEAFKLYDTFGLPLDIAKDVAREHGFTVDEDGFQAALAAQRGRARSAAKFGLDQSGELYRNLGLSATPFLGYDTLTSDATVVALIKHGEPADAATEGEEVELVLSATPFYAEKGGQVGDTGTIAGATGLVEVRDTLTPIGDIIVHRGVVAHGYIQAGGAVAAQVDVERRLDIARNHTATHLLHKALREVLGEHAQQRGSLVAPDRLRFDFAHLNALSEKELHDIEQRVNAAVRADYSVAYSTMSQNEARAAGATMLFGEKYGDIVRMISVGDSFSRELCGGTHLHATGQIGLFLISSESSIGAGLRRIEAITGRGAEAFVRERLGLLASVAQRVQAQPHEIMTKLDVLAAEHSAAQREIERLQREAAKAQVGALLQQVQDVKGVKLLAARVSASSNDALREMTDWLRDRMGSGIVVLGAVLNERPAIVCAVTPDLVAKGFRAGDIVKKTAALVGGSGGGRPDLAQAGGKDASKLDEAIKAVAGLV
jgi:alanyl-tRNA synthetase